MRKAPQLQQCYDIETYTGAVLELPRELQRQLAPAQQVESNKF